MKNRFICAEEVAQELSVSKPYAYKLIRQLNIIESAIWHDIQREKALEEQKRKEQVPRKLSDRLQWGRERSQEYNMQQKKNRTKHRGMEL